MELFVKMINGWNVLDMGSEYASGVFCQAWVFLKSSKLIFKSLIKLLQNLLLNLIVAF